jgi:Putative zinc-finger
MMSNEPSPRQPDEHARLRDLLAGYAAGTLPARERATLTEHLNWCSDCVARLAGWRAIAGGTRTALPAVTPSRDVLDGIRLRVSPSAPIGPSVLLALVRAQVPLVRPQIWSASALVLSLGVLVTLVNHRGGAALMSLVAPIVAAAGIAFIYGPENDPSLELALATPTPARLVLLARLTIVVAFDLGVAILASGGVVALGDAPDGLGQLILQWLGPMLLLSATSLWLSVAYGPLPATFVPLTLWAAKVGIAGIVEPLSAAATIATTLSSTNAVTVGVAALIATAVLVQVPHNERLA